MDGCSRWTLISIFTSYRCFTHSLFIRANYGESNRRSHLTVSWLESDITDAGQTFSRGDTMRNTMCAQKASLYCPSHPGFYQTYSESNRASCCWRFQVHMPAQVHGLNFPVRPHQLTPRPLPTHPGPSQEPDNHSVTAPIPVSPAVPCSSRIHLVSL